MNNIKDQEYLNQKIVLLRLDLNVPLKNGVITDETRINKILPIINFLIKKNDIDTYIDYENNQLTPGNFLVFNRICKENKIDLNNNFIDNLDILLSLYKKKKDINLINMTLYLTDLFFYRLYKDKSSNIDKIDSDKSFVISNLNKFISFNLNQNSFLNAINYKLSNG